MLSVGCVICRLLKDIEVIFKLRSVCLVLFSCGSLFALSPAKPCTLNTGTSEVKVAQSCPAPCHPGDYTVRGILQARILEWGAFPFSRGSSHPGIEPESPALRVNSLPAEPQRQPLNRHKDWLISCMALAALFPGSGPGWHHGILPFNDGHRSRTGLWPFGSPPSTQLGKGAPGS